MENEKGFGEDVMLGVRQHPIVLLRAVLVNIAALVVLAGISRALDIFGFLLLYLIPLVILIFELVHWYGRKYLVTALQVIKQESLFPSGSLYVPLTNIKEVVPRQSILGKALRYGSIKLEIYGQEEIVAFYFIPEPDEFSQTILQQAERCLERTDRRID